MPRFSSSLQEKFSCVKPKILNKTVSLEILYFCYAFHATTGALYDDNTTDSQKIDDRVQPGARHVYRWLMNDHDAPTDSDPDCLTWMYHSHRHGETELHAGLLGPLIVCKKGNY